MSDCVMLYIVMSYDVRVKHLYVVLCVLALVRPKVSRKASALGAAGYFPDMGTLEFDALLCGCRLKPQDFAERCWSPSNDMKWNEKDLKKEWKKGRMNKMKWHDMRLNKMHEWMTWMKWMNEWINERMNGWMNEQKWTNEWNEMKWDEMKWMQWNELKWIEMRWNERKWNENE
jgi:hypothetical protein